MATYSNTTSVNVTYTPGSGPAFNTHNVKACTNNNCSTGCLGVTQDLSSPVTVASLVNGSSYFICIQSANIGTETSAYVASGNSVTIDTTNPTAPSGVSFPATFSNALNANLSWTNSSDANFSTHNIKLCTSNNCSTGCTSVVQSTASPATVSGLTNATTYYGCVQGVDLAANTSAYVASVGTVTVDCTQEL